MHLAGVPGTERQPRFCLAGLDVRLEHLKEGSVYFPREGPSLGAGVEAGRGAVGYLVLILTEGLP